MWTQPYPDWLDADDIAGDSVSDFSSRMSGNKLSVYLIDDVSNVGRVLAALAIRQESPKDYAYALISREALEQLDISIEVSTGATDDAGVNAWHRDITTLSGKKVVELSKIIGNGLVEPFTHQAMVEAIKQSLEYGYIKDDNIAIKTKKLRKDIGL